MQDVTMQEPTAEERVKSAQQWISFVQAESLDFGKVMQMWMHMQKHISALDSASRPGPDGVTKQQMTVVFSALFVELGELMQELNWKPWKAEKDLDPFRIADEFADIMAFLGLLMSYLDTLGISPQNLVDAYTVKSRVNVDRLSGKVMAYRSQTNTLVEPEPAGD